MAPLPYRASTPIPKRLALSLCAQDIPGLHATVDLSYDTSGRQSSRRPRLGVSSFSSAMNQSSSDAAPAPCTPRRPVPRTSTRPLTMLQTPSRPIRTPSHTAAIVADQLPEQSAQDRVHYWLQSQSPCLASPQVTTTWRTCFPWRRIRKTPKRLQSDLLSSAAALDAMNKKSLKKQRQKKEQQKRALDRNSDAFKKWRSHIRRLRRNFKIFPEVRTEVLGFL